MNRAGAKIMTDYVKRRAIGFAEWLDENHWIRDRTNMWYQYIGESVHAIDIERLYEEFLKTVVE